LSVNVTGTFYSYKYAAQQMAAQGEGGRIIDASSLAGKKGRSIYAAVFFLYDDVSFQACFTQRLQPIELGHDGITVNAYAPGTIQTPMRDLFANVHGMLILTFFSYFKFKRLSAVGDLGTTQDVANLVSFLVTPEARFITGVYIIHDQVS
ncbi:acetoin dehydrogenase, partial [Suillus variegatus]